MAKCYLATTAKQNRLESEKGLWPEIWKILVNKVVQYIIREEKEVEKNL